MSELTCDKCHIKSNSYVESVNHRCFTISEWKRFCKNPVKAESNEFQFVNYHTQNKKYGYDKMKDEAFLDFDSYSEQQKESYDYLTTAEVLLAKHTIYLRDHIMKKRIGRMAKTPFKEALKDGLKSLPSKITAKNFDKGMKEFDKALSGVTGALDQLGDGLGGNKNSNKKNLDMLWGKKSKKSKPNHDFLFSKPSKSKTPKFKLYSDKPKKKKASKKRKSKSDEWDDREAIWGKRR